MKEEQINIPLFLWLTYYSGVQVLFLWRWEYYISKGTDQILSLSSKTQELNIHN